MVLVFVTLSPEKIDKKSLNGSGQRALKLDDVNSQPHVKHLQTLSKESLSTSLTTEANTTPPVTSNSLQKIIQVIVVKRVKSAS